jgi:AAA family ATP:ADP antiporter
MFGKIARTLWGDLSKDEVKKFGLLTLTFLFIIGSYWTMRPLKDVFFMKIVGKTYLPYVKMLALFVLIPLVMVYAKLVDRFEKDKLFYIICTVYAVVYFIFSFLIMHPTMGLANPVTSPSRLLGWIIYLTVDSFGVLVTSLFWSFVTSTTETVSAKKGYALILGGAQVGSIIGPTLSTKASVIGIQTLVFISIGGILAIMAMIKLVVHLGFGANVVKEEIKQPTGMFEGLRLLLSKPYLLGILGVSTLFEVIGNIMEYQMLFSADVVYKTPEKIAEFLGLVGQCVNIVPLVVSLLGASLIIRKLGLTFGLVAFPFIMGIFVLNVLFHNGLWSLFFAVVCAKGLSYGLNNPCKEIMYIPTSKDVRFKAKSWIDVFGGRTAKGTGAGVCAFFSEMSSLMLWGSIISLGVIAFWIPVAFFVGQTNKKLVQENKIIS